MAGKTLLPDPKDQEPAYALEALQLRRKALRKGCFLMRRKITVRIPELPYVYAYILREKPWAIYFNADAEENNVVYIY